ncbi:MAG TPA: hypothetical protein VHQ46_04045 [Desulfobacteria bacterium]|nr:hypothetical protein [Desulfobacteria bacterium]
MRRNWRWLLVLAILAVVFMVTKNVSMPGADDQVSAVANKYAAEVGAKETKPLFNTAPSDLQLFIFALGGAVAGFWLGYNCHDLFGAQSKVKDRSEEARGQETRRGSK